MEKHIDIKILIPIKGGRHDHAHVPLTNALKGGALIMPQTPPTFLKIAI